MKLEKIHIRAFGKLKNFELDFSDGVNLIFGENEAGKTTVMAFIKMMFYGSGKSTANLSRSPRRKYEPLDGSPFGGTVEFTQEGIRYRLDRDFRKSDSLDRVTLWNLNTGTKEPVDSGNEIGFRFFNLSASAFDRTVFVSGALNCTGDSAASGEIGGKLANLVSSGDEEISFETVAGRLASARQVYLSKSGQIGITDKLKAHLRTLYEKRNEAQESDRERKEKCDRIESLQNLIGQMEQQCESLQNDIALSERYEKGKSLQKVLNGYRDLGALRRELEETETALQAGDIKADDAYFASLEELFSELKALRSRIRECPAPQSADTEDPNRLAHQLAADEAQLKTLVAEQDNLKNQIDSLRACAEKTGKHPNLILLITGISVMAAAVAAGVFWSNYAYFGAALGALLAVLGLLIRRLPKQVIEAQAELTIAQNQLQNTHSAIAALNQKIEADHKLIEAAAAELKQKDAENRLQEKYQETEQALISLLSSFGDAADIDRCIALTKQLKSDASKASQLRAKIAVIESMLAGSDSKEDTEAALEALGELPAAGDSRLLGMTDKRLRLGHLTVRITDLKSELSSLTTEIRTTYRGRKTVPQVENEIRAAEQSLAEQESYCAALDLAYQVLKDSFTELMGSFGPALNRRTAEIFSAITGGKYHNAVVSKDLAVSAESRESGGLISWEYLSDGTADQAYLALRLAVSELIGKDSEPLPILLDDPFLQYDDSRAAQGFRFLKDYAACRQILLFTCRSAERTAAQENGASVLTLG